MNSFVIQKFILLRFDHHSTGEVRCHPYTISRSSQVCGVFGCRIIVISIEDNGSTTVFLSHIHSIQVAHILIGGASWPWYSAAVHAQTGMDKTHTKRWFSVIPFPLVSPPCVIILRISTCSMIRFGTLLPKTCRCVSPHGILP